MVITKGLAPSLFSHGKGLLRSAAEPLHGVRPCPDIVWRDEPPLLPVGDQAAADFQVRCQNRRSRGHSLYYLQRAASLEGVAVHRGQWGQEGQGTAHELGHLFPATRWKKLHPALEPQLPHQPLHRLEPAPFPRVDHRHPGRILQTGEGGDGGLHPLPGLKATHIEELPRFAVAAGPFSLEEGGQGPVGDEGDSVGRRAHSNQGLAGHRGDREYGCGAAQAPPLNVPQFFQQRSPQRDGRICVGELPRREAVHLEDGGCMWKRCGGGYSTPGVAKEQEVGRGRQGGQVVLCKTAEPLGPPEEVGFADVPPSYNEGIALQLEARLPTGAQAEAENRWSRLLERLKHHGHVGGRALGRRKDVEGHIYGPERGLNRGPPAILSSFSISGKGRQKQKRSGPRPAPSALRTAGDGISG